MPHLVASLPKKQHGRRILDEHWDGHRERILYLWLYDGEEGRKLEDVVEIMRSQHGFTATLSQYHNRLVKKWNVRKFITKNEWRKLYWDEMDRRSAGETIQVFFNKRLIAAEKKAREWERYAFASEPRPRPQDLTTLPETFRYEIIRPVLQSPVFNIEDFIVTSPMEALTLEHEIDVDGYASGLSLSPFFEHHSMTPVNLSPRFETIPSTFTVQPFSWANGIDWVTLSRAMSLDLQLVRLRRPDPSQLSSMFYSQQQMSLTPSSGADTLVLRHIVSSIINGIKANGLQDQTGIYRWLTSLPRPAVLGLFASFPAEILDVIRHRIRVYAASGDDPDTVQAILALEYELSNKSPYTSTEISTVLKSISRESCDSRLATIVVRYASRVCIDQDMVLRQLINVYYDRQRNRSYRAKLSHSDWVPLIQIPLLAGARPTVSCFAVARYDVDTLERLLMNGNKDILFWVEQGLLTVALNEDEYNPQFKTPLEWTLKKLTSAMFSWSAEGKWTTAHETIVASAISNAFSLSLQRPSNWSTEVLYDTCQRMGYTLVYSRYNRNLNDKVLGLCKERDWAGARAAVTAAKEDPYKKSFADLTEAIAADDYRRIKKELRPPSDADALDLAISSGSDNVAALIAARNPPWAVLLLLKHGGLRAISKMLCRNSHWAGILQEMSSTGNHERLEDILYRKQPHKNCDQFPCQLHMQDIEGQQIALQALGYHAMYQRDLHLLDWLCKRDLAVEGILVEHEDSEIYRIWPVPDHKRGRLLGQPSTYDIIIQLPSLLDVATQHNDLVLMDYFYSQTPVHKHSNALLCAVKSNAQPATIEYLIRKDGVEVTGVRTQYGSAALRVAIRNRNHDLVRLLAKTTDVHGLEPIDCDNKDDVKYLDPLGEAVLRNNAEAVETILDNGGDPNALVAFSGLSTCAPRVAEYSILMRLTALLVAIDTGNLELIKLLVERGANVDRRLDMGLLRTPLQRAAEIGDFQMVQFFIEKGAKIDSEPAFGGGTALQLAAMSGHVGIARLLIEHGADVNYPPAKGPGRTAFEAAAEWCRPDMMYLLVQYGAQLDLEITGEVEVDDFPSEAEFSDDPDAELEPQWHTFTTFESQYERAIEFAECRGEHASANIVQSLYDKTIGEIR